MARRAPQTLADYMVVGISPALVMFMVGSLVWFLTIVFYQGDYGWRLLMVHAFFVMGAVSVTRLAMEEGAGYASIFGVVLAAVVAYAYISFVKVQGPLAALSPVINLGLEAVIWFSAHKLTWDCTLNDDTQDSTQEGLLQSMGFDRVEGEIPPPRPHAGDATTEIPASRDTLEATTSREVQVFHWIRSFFVHDKRPHTPGVWIVYFSLAALPLFGIGQWFIPSEQLELRRQAFWLLVVYVSSGLGLLLNTSFLGLRRYLRQRNLQMPTEMAATWLGTGVLLILAVLLFVSLLPRPSAEYSVAQIEMFKSKPLDPSRWGWGKDGSQQQTDAKNAGGEGGRKSDQAQSSKQGDSKQQSSGQGKGSKKGDGKGNDGESSKGKSQGEKSSGGKGTGKDKSSDGQKTQESGSDGEKGESKSGEKGDSKQENNQKGSDKSDRQSSDQNSQPDSSQQRDQTSQDSSDKDSQGKLENESEQNSQDNESSSNDSSSARPRPSYASQQSWLSRLSPTLGQILKWLFYALVLVTLLVLAWIYRAEIVAAWKKLVAELRTLWTRWFGGVTTGAAAEIVPPVASARPFATYADPFASGLAANTTLAELVRYTFEALEAWGREHQSPRGTGQTAHEYAQQVGRVYEPLAGDARFLAELYGQLAYAGGSVRQANVEPLKSLWQRMRGA